MRGIRERSLLLKRERGEKFPFYLPIYPQSSSSVCPSIHPSIRPRSYTERNFFLPRGFCGCFGFLTPLLRHLVDRLMKELFHHSPLVIIVVFIFIPLTAWCNAKRHANGSRCRHTHTTTVTVTTTAYWILSFTFCAASVQRMFDLIYHGHLQLQFSAFSIWLTMVNATSRTA